MRPSWTLWMPRFLLGGGGWSVHLCRAVITAFEQLLRWITNSEVDPTSGGSRISKRGGANLLFAQAKARKRASESILALKPRADVSRSPKQLCWGMISRCQQPISAKQTDTQIDREILYFLIRSVFSISGSAEKRNPFQSSGFQYRK